MNYEGAITPAKITLESDTTRTDGQNLELDGWTDVKDGTTTKWDPDTPQDFTEKETTPYSVWKIKGYLCSVCNDGIYYEVKHYSCTSRSSL